MTDGEIADRCEAEKGHPAAWAKLHEKQRTEIECITRQRGKLIRALREALRRMKQYEMDVDCEPPIDHRAFMKRASKLLVDCAAQSDWEDE